MKNDHALVRRRRHSQVSRRRLRASWAGGLLAAVAIAFLALAAVAPLASSADASTSFVFAGRGNGHGAGMSQWGAWQGAREGNSYAQILAFYYPGTTLEQTADPDEILKVRVSSKPWTSNTTNFTQVDVEPTVAPATLRLYTSSANYTTLDVPLGSAVRSVNTGGKVKVSVDGEAQGSFIMMELVPGSSGSSEGRVEITLKTSGASIDPREYWGTIRVQYGDDAGELWVYNFVRLEKYVRSIAEVDYDWATVGGDYYAIEAVKAQAVASRTYAVAKNGATLSDSWADQCYRGYSFEAKYPGIAQAAQATAGQILTYGGEPITAYFSGHSGGYTSTSAWFGTKPPYMISQADPWSLKAPPTGVGKGTGWAWTYTISADSVSDKVNGSLKDTSGKIVNVGTISDIQIVARDTADATSHATRLRLAGGNGSATVSVLSFRSLIGTSNLPSTLILTINGDTGTGTTVGDSGGDQGEDGGSGGGDPGGSGGGTPLMPGEFYDVGTSHLYHDEISRVVTAELMGGYENGLFKPDGTVSRAQFAKIAVSLYNLMHAGDQIAVVNVTTRPFDDVAIDSKKVGDISDWIAAAKDAGLISGISATNFSPYDDVERDQMATMLCRALGWQDESEALSTDTLGFADVPVTSPHWAAAAYLKQKGVLLGYGDSADGSAVMLGAGEAIKRQHVAVILCRVLDLPR